MTVDAQLDHSSRVTSFIAGTGPADLPPDAVERAKRSILDLLGCAAFGRSAESVEPALRYITRRRSAGDSTIFFGGGKASAEDAALINGSYVHSTEMSETFTRALAHPGNTVIPALLAVAERERLSGRAVLTGTAVGYELLIRLGLAAGPDLVLSQGLHPPATLGTFGATAAVATMLGLDEAETASAMGIAACSVPSQLIVAMYRHSTVKDLFQAYAASIGVFAAGLAAEGMTGPSDWLEAWTAAIPRVMDLDRVTDRLGEFWHLSSGGLHFKLLPVMAMAAPSLGALRHIHETDPELDPTKIDDILIESSGRIELGRIDFPTTMVSARGSLPFLAAAALLDRERFLDDRYFLSFLRPELLTDPAVRELAGRVRLRVDPEFDHNMEVAWPMKFEARVTVRLTDGRTLVGYHDTWPATSTMSYADVADKFRAISAGRLSAGRADEIVAAVSELDTASDITGLVSLLA